MDRQWTPKRLQPLIFALHSLHNSSTVGLWKTDPQKTQKTQKSVYLNDPSRLLIWLLNVESFPRMSSTFLIEWMTVE